MFYCKNWLDNEICYRFNWMMITQPFWVETWEDDNTYKHFIYVISSSFFDFIYHNILIF
jgi:hypothetical protein